MSAFSVGACLLLVNLAAEQVAAKVDLQRQSLVFPDTSQSIQEDWFHGGGAHLHHGQRGIDNIILNAGVPDHPSLLFNQEPMPTDNFEASFVVSIRPADIHNDGFIYEGLAFWYVHEDPMEVRKINNQNEQKRRQAKVKGERFGLFGYRGNYKGLGAFVFFDAGSPMMTAIVNKGGRKRVTRHDVFGALYGLGLFDVLHGESLHGEDDQESAKPGEAEHEDEFLDQEARGNKGATEIQVKLRVTPTAANITVVGAGTLNFDFSEAPHPGKGAYLGLSALSYAARRDPHLKPIGIELHDLKVVSFAGVEEKSKKHESSKDEYYEGGDFEEEGSYFEQGEQEL